MIVPSISCDMSIGICMSIIVIRNAIDPSGDSSRDDSYEQFWCMIFNVNVQGSESTQNLTSCSAHGHPEDHDFMETVFYDAIQTRD